MRNDQETSSVLNLVKSFVERERQRYTIKAAYLFGSWAYGTPNADSDIDIGLILERALSIEEEASIFSDAQEMHYRLEPHVYTQKQFDIGKRAIIEDIKEHGIKIA